MAKVNRSKLTVFSLNGKRSYTLHGVIYLVDGQGAPHYFAVRVMAESKQAATKYLAYLGTEQNPYIGWMVEQTILADSTGAWLPLPVTEAAAPQPGLDILAAFIRPIEFAQTELPEFTVTLQPGIPVTKEIPANQHGRDYNIKLTVDGLSVQVSVRPNDSATAVHFRKPVGSGEHLYGPFRVATLVDAITNDSAGATLGIETSF